MPFHSTPRLTVNVRSERIDDCSEKVRLVFEGAYTGAVPYSTGAIHHSPDPDAGKEPRVLSVQRLGAGDAIDKDVWYLKEVDDPALKECVPNLRFFQLLFDGVKYTDRLADRCNSDHAKALNLYRSLIGEERIRFTLAFPVRDRGNERIREQKKSPVLLPLEVELRYRLAKT